MTWDGLLIVNKPDGETSHTVVQAIKKRLKATKAGHLGTLDPLATGVFPVCLGKATRLAPFYMKAEKCYLTAIRFGFFTTTDDREGQQEGPYRKVEFSETALRTIVEGLKGEYQQRPPVYSAKKIHGQKSYKVARQGGKLNLPMQKVNIYDIRLLSFEKDLATVFIHCSSGTYVRSIARDIGMRLRCGAHVHDLARTRFGEFTLEQSCPPEAPLEDLKRSFIPLEKCLAHLPELILTADLSRKIMSGSPVEVPEAIGEEWVRVFNQEKALLAIAQVSPGEANRKIQPKIVFSPA